MLFLKKCTVYSMPDNSAENNRYLDTVSYYGAPGFEDKFIIFRFHLLNFHTVIIMNCLRAEISYQIEKRKTFKAYSYLYFKYASRY